MKRNREQQAYDRAQNKAQEQWLAEKPITKADKEYGQYQRAMERNQGFATGWIAGIAWAKRQKRKD